MQPSDRINLGIRTAARVHDGQYRRCSPTPYAAHPFAVALISQKYTDDENVFIACLLHDVLEDVPERIYSSEDMYNDFGSEVLKIVKDVTEPNVEAVAWRAWQVRKDAYLAHLAAVNDARPLIVSACDKMHNMSEIVREISLQGEGVWNAFYVDKSREIWFFESVLEILKSKTFLPNQIVTDYEIVLAKLKEIA